ncbi:MAG TPA: cation transporter [Coleofasciculaceae cyanobacterium]|jgi:divalent metal cation (Fe/Co/Zn/Cd) transporter
MKGTNRLLRQGLLLEYLTLGWNVVGTGVVIVSGLQASSIALVGFALDSLIEICASIVVIWQLNGVNQKREQQALRLIGTAFFMLATYILIQSSNTLLDQSRSSSSLVGIVWLIATFLAMLALAAGKAHTGRKLDNPVLKAEARVTLVDAYLAGSVLIGLLLNALLGWWWADPLAGLVIVFYGFKEGWHAWDESA